MKDSYQSKRNAKKYLKRDELPNEVIIASDTQSLSRKDIIKLYEDVISFNKRR